MTRFRRAPAAVVLLAVLVLASAGAAAQAQTGGQIAGAMPAAGGIGLVVWGGGTTGALRAAALARGCALDAAWVTGSRGEFVGYVYGAPEFVNASFAATFAGPAIPPNTPLILGCSSLEARAAQVARAALPTPADLPGAGWRVRSMDEFPDMRFEPQVQSPACLSLKTKIDAVSVLLETQRPARAATGLEQRNSVARSAVTAAVYVYRDAQSAERLGNAYRQSIEGTEYLTCVNEIVAQLPARASGVRPIVSAIAATPVPHGGTQLAVEVVYFGDGAELRMRAEFYAWRVGNAVAVMTVSGASDSATEAAARAAVQRTQQRLEAALAR